MLNEPLYRNLFSFDTPKEASLMILKIYLQLADRKGVERVISSGSNKKLWEYIISYFQKDDGKIGTIINKDISNLDLSVENIFRVEQLLENNHRKITPTYFTKICGTAGLIVFIIKDIFEWSGILYEKKCNPPKVFELCNYSCQFYSKMMMK